MACDQDHFPLNKQTIKNDRAKISLDNRHFWAAAQNTDAMKLKFAQFGGPNNYPLGEVAKPGDGCYVYGNHQLQPSRHPAPTSSAVTIAELYSSAKFSQTSSQPNKLQTGNMKTPTSNQTVNHSWLRQFCAALLVTLLFALMANNARATLQAYEAFNYSTLANGTAAPTATATQTTSGGYSGTWTFGNAASASLFSAGLFYPSLLTTNKALTISTVATSYIQDNLATTLSSGTYYISYLFVTGNTVNGGSNSPTATFCDNGIQIAPSGTGLFLGVEAYGATAGKFTINKVANPYNDNSTTVYQSSTSDITYGTTNFIVIKLVSSSANNWNGSVWVNPTAGTSTEPTATGTFSGITCSSAIQQLALLNRAGGNTLTFDEIRVATTWADAVSYVPPPPSVPTGLGATAGVNSVALSWTASTGGPTSYNVKRSTTSGSGYVTVANVTGTSYTDAASSGSTYYYVVSALNASGESANSSPEQSAAPTAGLPTAPAGLSATANSTSLTLNWTAAAGAPTSYNVKRSTTSGSGYATISTSGAVTGTTFTDSAASPGTTYYYVVSAVNTFGEGANSSQTSGVVSAAGPIAYDSMSYSGSQINTVTAAPTATPTTTVSGGFTGNWAGGALNWFTPGLTYASLPTAGGYDSYLGANNLYETVASAPASGSVYVSFLYQFAGTPGGNRDGIIMIDSSGNGVMFSYHQNSASAYPCLVPITGTTTRGTELTPDSSTLRVAASTHLYVLKFNYTAGVVTSVNVYSDPTAGQGTAPTADFTVSSGLPSFGALSKIGMLNPNVDPLAYDEVRVGTSFGAVVGLAGPSVTTGFTATGTNNAVNLKWNSAANATSYNVLRSTASGLEQSLTNVTGTTLSDITAVNGTTYYYVVQSVNGLGGSAFSTEQSATPLAPPAAPTALGATPGVNSVALSWTASSGATGYNVKRSTTSGSGYAILVLGTNVSGLTYTDNSAVGGTTYYYVVSALNAGGESANSSEVSALPTVAAPGAPSSLVATPTSGSVGLTWTLGTGAASYNVYRSTTSGSGYSVVSTPGAVTTTAYTDTTTANGTIYYYVVTSTNSAGESAATSEATAAMPPAAPTGLGAVGGSNQVALSWTASAGTSGAVSYNVKRSTTSGSGYTTISTSGAVTGTSYTDLTALSGTTYYYVVSGVNATGQGGNSGEANATPTGAPQSPTGLTATANSVSITLNWTAALGAPASYNVKRSTTSGSGYVAISTSGAVTGTSFTDSGAAPGTTYYYVVSAVNTYGESANSSQASTAVSPAGPLAYDSMNYPGATGGQINSTTAAPTGTPTVTANGGFTGNWVGGALTYNSATLTYPSLPTTGGSLAQLGANTLYETVAGAPASGTVFVSFLFKQTGDNGGNRAGLFFDDSTGSGVMFAYQQISGIAGKPAIIGMSGTTTVGSQIATSSATQTYVNSNLYVLKFTYTSGVVSRIDVYSNPTAATSSGTIDFSITSGLPSFGAISKIGVGGNAWTVQYDEVRVGTSFGAVVGLAGPSTPTGFTATPTNNGVNLSWSAAANATSYNVLRSTASGLEQSLVTGVTGTTYSDTTAVNGTTYYYVVQSVNGLGGSAFSTEQSATPIAPPAAPTGLVATPGVNTVGLSWTASTGSPVSYNVYRSTTSGSGYSVISAPGAVTTTAYTDNSAVGGTTYYYVVTAVNAGGESANSSEVPATPTIAAPSAPSSLVATPSSGQVLLGWSAGTGAASYNVYRSTTSGSGYAVVSTPGAVTTTAYTDTTTANGTIYYYVVTSTNSAGESAATSEATAAMPPAAPTGLGAVGGSNQVALSWTASAGTSGAVSYNVKRSTTSGSGYTTISTSGAVTGTSYTDLTALSGTTYYYVVSGVNATGQGGNSGEANATPTGAPQSPTALTITTNYLSLTLNWTAALGSPTGYNVKRSTSTGAETTLPAGTNVSGTSFTDTTVVVGTQYFYTVSAVNGDGESADSSEVSGIAPGTPSAYESFNYGSLANGTATTGTGFTGNWMITNGATIVANMTYTGLVTSNSAMQVANGNQYENLSVPIFTGTVYVSLLYYQNGNAGAVYGGFQLLNSSGNGIHFGYHEYGAAQGLPGIFPVTGYNTVGAALGYSGTPETYQTNNLYVLKLDYSGGVLSNVSVFSNPTPGQPEPAPDFSVTTGLSGVGAITTLGTHVHITSSLDEWRVGTTFASVVPQLLSTNAYLTSLSFSPSSGFAPALTPTVLTGYNETNNYGDTPTVTVINADPTATNTLIVNGVSQGILANNTASAPFSLGLGNTNVVQVQVVSQDLAVTNTYVVNATVLSVSLGTNSQLASLSISPAGTLNPAFDPGTLGYNATNAYADSSVTVAATSTDANATLQLSFNGGAYGSATTGSLSIGGNTLVLPTNTVLVQVVSQDLSQTNVYTVNVVLQPNTSSPPVLANSVSGGALSLDWGADHLGYRLLVQTNNLANGVSGDINDWMTVPGSESITSTNITIITAGVTNEYYQLVYP